MPKCGAYFSLNVCLAGDDSLARTRAADAIAPASDAPPAFKNSRRCTATTPGTIVETTDHFLSLTSALLESNHFASAGVQSDREFEGRRWLKPNKWRRRVSSGWRILVRPTVMTTLGCFADIHRSPHDRIKRLN